MAKQKLTKDQNLQLQGLGLAQKRELLTKWFKNGEITREQFNFFSNRWIRKKTKQILREEQDPLKRFSHENIERRCSKSVAEIEMEIMISHLRSRINNYVTSRFPDAFSAKELSVFAEYIEKNKFHRSLVNQMVALGLRYPDKNLNELCSRWIKENRMDPNFPSFDFWSLLWEDGDLVPMDAVRLMVTKQEESYHIDENFNKELMRYLIPLIEIQKNKEAQRLKWAEALSESEADIARKTRRLNAFDILLNAAAEYVRK